MIDELEAHAPFIEQRYDDEVALALKAALTDAELFISYNMPAKALDPLIGVLPSAPRDLRLNQRLAALHTRAGRFAEAAVCCRTLESIYHDAGHAAEASKYSDLAARYEQRSAPKNAAPAVAEAPIPVSAPAPVPVAPSVPEFEISVPSPDPLSEAEAAVAQSASELSASGSNASATHSGLFLQQSAPVAAPEMPVATPPAPMPQDFSVAAPAEPATEPAAQSDSAEAWEQDFAIGSPQHSETLPGENAPVTPEIHAEAAAQASETLATPVASSAPLNMEESIEEIRFYIGQGMTEQAEQILEKLEAIAPGAPELALLRRGIESAKQPSSIPELRFRLTNPKSSLLRLLSRRSLNPPPQFTRQRTRNRGRPNLLFSITPAAQVEAPVAESLDPLPEPVRAGRPPAPAPAAPKFAHGTLDEFVADLEASLGNDFAVDAPPVGVNAPIARLAQDIKV